MDHSTRTELNPTQATALEYLRRGIAPMPCRGKSAIRTGWSREPVPTEDQVIADFSDSELNIGVRLGDVSGGLIDVDIDTPRARDIAPAFLPQTDAISGRLSNPKSHHWYYEQERSRVRSAVFKNITGKIILEIRGDGQQTIAPGSTHEGTGEPIQWVGDRQPGEPAIIAYDDLLRRCGWLAATTILSETLPDKDGQRHEIALALAGGFATHNVSREKASSCIRIAASFARADVADMLKAVESSYDRIEAGESATGFRALSRIIGSHAVRLIRKYTGTEDPDDRAVVNLDIEDVNTIGDRVLAALDDVGTEFYVGVDGSLSRVIESPEGQLEIRPLSDDQLRERIGRHVRCQRPGRVTKTEPNPDPVTANLPMDVVRNIQGRVDTRFPYLRRISTAPELDVIGSIHPKGGYNPLTRSFLPDTDEWGRFLNNHRFRIQTESKDIEASVDLFRELLCDFPFTSDADFAHAISLLLAPFGRELIPGRIPVFLFDKPEPGTGATLAVEVLTSAYYGPGGLIPTPEPESEAEWTKTLIARGLAGYRGFFLDNLRNPLDSGVVSSAITQDFLDGRVLGTNKTIRVPTPDVWVVTANNPAISTEMARRIVRVRLDARMDRPFERTRFRHKLPEWSNEQQYRLIEAALLIWRAWVWEGRPKGTVSLGSFDGWAKTMGGVLDVVGIPGFLANATDFYESADVEGKAWRAVVGAWWEDYGSTPTTARELFALPPVTETLVSGASDKDRAKFGRLLSAQRDRWFGTLRIEQSGLNRDKVQTYCLVHRDGQSRPRRKPEAAPSAGPFGRRSTSGTVSDLLMESA